MKKGSLGQNFHIFNKNLKKPVKINSIDNLIDISIGNYHGGAVDKNGNAYSWGYIDHGKLGHSLDVLNPEMDLRSVQERSEIDNIIK